MLRGPRELAFQDEDLLPQRLAFDLRIGDLRVVGKAAEKVALCSSRSVPASWPP